MISVNPTDSVKLTYREVDRGLFSLLLSSLSFSWLLFFSSALLQFAVDTGYFETNQIFADLPGGYLLCSGMLLRRVDAPLVNRPIRPR